MHRERKRPKPYNNYVALLCDIIDREPSNYEEDVKNMKNDVCKIVPRKEKKYVMNSKWIYKIKHVKYGSIDENKERLVAQGFSQKEGIEYKESFHS